MTETNSTLALDSGPLISWYGDDLTGAAAVLEVLSTAGLRSVLFMDIPTPAELAPYASWPGIGIAGTARHREPEWMDENLPHVFDFIASLAAPIAHYKVCSTFDSSPTVGSIGKAIDLAQPILGGDWIPLLVAAPPLGRYQSFGNLFASADDIVYRLDRHPTMSRHPVTPMHEADIRRHLAAQTATPIGLVDAVSFNKGEAQAKLVHEIVDGVRIVALDVMDEAMMLEVGRLLWENRGDRILAVGSQGVEYALTRYWRDAGMIRRRSPTNEVGRAEHFAAVSASVSPVTGAQLEWASRNGFDLIRMDVVAAVDEEAWSREIDRTTERAQACVRTGGSPIVYTALGPDDPSVSALDTATALSDSSAADIRERIGEGLGHVLDRLVRGAGVDRCAVIGGDTSGQVTRVLGIRSLTFLAPMGHATSMMLATTSASSDPALQYTLKGGQMGSVDFFGRVRNLGNQT